MKTLHYCVNVFTLNLRKILAYRADFWGNLILYFIGSFALGYFLWDAIFTTTQKEIIGGRNFHQMMLYYVLAPMLSRSVRGPMYFFMSREIYQGELNKYLVYPVNYFAYSYSIHLSYTIIFFLQVCAGLILFILFWGLPVDHQISFLTMTASFVFVIFASLLFFFMSACLQMISFFADNVWSLIVMLRFMVELFGGAFLPLSVFPESMQTILTYLPFSYLVHFPAQIALGQLGLYEFINACGVLTIWTLIFAIMAQLIWKKGLKGYAGVGI